MAKRISLREFQQNLTARLTSAARGQGTSAMLGVRSGKDHWLIDLTESGEIVPLTQLTPVPLTKPWFTGIANIRGNLFSVVDFSAFQGLEPTPVNSESRLVLVGARFGINAALLVNQMLGLRNPSQFTVAPARPDAAPWVAKELTDAEGRVWKKLNVRDLLTFPDFIQIGV